MKNFLFLFFSLGCLNSYSAPVSGEVSLEDNRVGCNYSAPYKKTSR